MPDRSAEIFEVMKPPPFAYLRPTSLQEALEALDDDDGALPLAGGQSLVPMLNMRLARPSTVIDISRIPGLTDVTQQQDSVVIGARVTHHALGQHPALASITALPRAVAEIGFQAIRHRGTIGGSLAHADPAAELPTLLLALDASVNLSSMTGSRSVPMDEFLVGYYSTSRRADELVTAVNLPATTDLRTGFAEFSRRTGDFALALAAVATWTADGTRHARVSVGGLDVRPRRIAALESLLASHGPESAAAAVSSDLLDAETSASSDIHGTAGYRLELGVEMVRRAIEQLAEAA